jgi:hypothetical protein
MIKISEEGLIVGGGEGGEDKIALRMIELINDRLSEAEGQYGCDLHNYLFNEDVAFTYTSVAEDACERVGVFSAIRLVRKYETDNFGATNTEIEPDKIANMLVYIYGEYLLQVSDAVDEEQWDRELTAEDLAQIEGRIQSWCEKNLPRNADYRTLDEQVWDYYGSY